MGDDIQALLGAWGAFLFSAFIVIVNLEGNKRMRLGELHEIWAPKGNPHARWKVYAMRFHLGITILFGFVVTIMGLFAAYVTLVILLSIAGLL